VLFVRQAAGRRARYAEEVSELGMLLIEDSARFPTVYWRRAKDPMVIGW